MDYFDALFYNLEYIKHFNVCIIELEALYFELDYFVYSAFTKLAFIMKFKNR